MEDQMPKAGGPDEAQQTAAQLERMVALAKLAQRIGHDLNNALTATVGLAGVALAEPDAAPETRACLESLQRAAERATVLAQQLLTLHRRMSRSHAFAQDLNALIRDLDPLLRQLTGETALDVRLGDANPLVAAETDDLEQVIVGLVQQARGRAQGQPIRLRTRVVQLGDPMPQPLMVPGSYVALEISAGPMPDGEPPAHQLSSRRQGAIFGLEMVVQLARKFGAALQIAGEGTEGAATVRLLVPMAELRSGDG